MFKWAPIVFIALAACAESADTDVQPAEETMETAVPAEEAAGSVTLFNGQDLAGWTPRGEATWEVVDGTITPLEGSGIGFLVTNESYDDFRLTAEFWVDDTANGGVFVRVPEAGEISQSNSFEINIYDAHANWPTGSINELQRNDAPNTVGQWNTFEITAEGNHLTVALNGENVVDVQAQRLPSGPIALQYNANGTIRYRNVEIQPL
jgi:hypothetical protein